MNNQEAKLILQAYRPGGEDASDPLFAEALEQARRDPELQTWFAEQNAFEARLQARLQTAIPVPRELKSDLLALRKLSRPVAWWFQPMKWAAAAAAVLLLGLGGFLLFPQHPAQLGSFREAMARYAAQQQGHVVFESHDMTAIRQWLRTRGSESNFDLPAALPGRSAEGCRVVDWEGHKATMLCFVVGGAHMDLFVMEGASLPELRERGLPVYAKAASSMTVAWSSGDKVYLLTGRNKELLQRVVEGASI